MRAILYLSAFTVLTSGCSTLDQSFRLGATTGALTGAAATYAAGSASGRSPSIKDVGIGASIGTRKICLARVFSAVEPRRDSLRRRADQEAASPPYNSEMKRPCHL
jgi:hypothetical protein